MDSTTKTEGISNRPLDDYVGSGRSSARLSAI